MKKFVIFIVIMAAIWSIPQARAKMKDVLHPVFAKLGPVGARMTQPMKKAEARTAIATIIRSIHSAHETGKDVPTARTFVRWLRAHPPTEEKDKDPWGTSYWMHQDQSSLTIGSNGPDGIKGNKDDISKTAPL